MINESCSLGNRVEGCNIPQTLKMKFKVATILGSASSVSVFYFSELFSKSEVCALPAPLPKAHCVWQPLLPLISACAAVRGMAARKMRSN